MKVNKIVCLDENVIDFLKTTNASRLINDLVITHMKDADVMSMTIPQLKAEKECTRLEKELKKQQQELRKNANC